jgi:hypothetical protein
MGENTTAVATCEELRDDLAPEMQPGRGMRAVRFPPLTHGREHPKC